MQNSTCYHESLRDTKAGASETSGLFLAALFMPSETAPFPENTYFKNSYS